VKAMEKVTADSMEVAIGSPNDTPVSFNDS